MLKNYFIKILFFVGIVPLMTGCEIDNLLDTNKNLCTLVVDNQALLHCTSEKCRSGYNLEGVYPSLDSCSEALDAFKSNFYNGN